MDGALQNQLTLGNAQMFDFKMMIYYSQKTNPKNKSNIKLLLINHLKNTKIELIRDQSTKSAHFFVLFSEFSQLSPINTKHPDISEKLLNFCLIIPLSVYPFSTFILIIQPPVNSPLSTGLIIQQMLGLIQKFKTLNYPKHYLLYCITFMLYATSMTGFGPLIPYLASHTGHKQTQYSILFFCKSIGFLAGSLLLNKIHDHKVFHTIMFWCTILLFISMTLFTYIVDFVFQSFIIMVIAMLGSMINILVNVCVVESQKNSDVHFWMLVLHGTYGIGGLISPLLISLFDIQSYFIMGILLGLLAPIYYKLKSPEANGKMFKWIVNSQFYEFESYDEASSIRTSKKKYLSQSSINVLCFIFWTYIGVELGFCNWISSYAVLQNIDSKHQALKYTSIFWISMTIFRFLSLLMPFRTMRKLIAHEYLLIGFTMLSIFLVFQNQAQNACLLSSVMFGVCFSSMYPLLLSAPIDYNLQISAAQMTQVALWSSLGEAVVAPAFGVLMNWFSHNMIFYSILALALVLVFLTHYLESLYEKDMKTKFSSSVSIELKETLLTDSS